MPVPKQLVARLSVSAGAAPIFLISVPDLVVEVAGHGWSTLFRGPPRRPSMTSHGQRIAEAMHMPHVTVLYGITEATFGSFQISIDEYSMTVTGKVQTLAMREAIKHALARQCTHRFTEPGGPVTTTTHQRLIEHLTANGIPFNEFEHPPAASAEEYSRVVGSALHEQAKALLLRRYRRSGGKDLLIHSLPGDQRGDLPALADPLEAKRLRLANDEELHQATGCNFGELPPVGSIFGLPLSIDGRLLTQKRIFFNAGRLDRSVVLAPNDLTSVEAPIIVSPRV